MGELDKNKEGRQESWLRQDTVAQLGLQKGVGFTGELEKAMENRAEGRDAGDICTGTKQKLVSIQNMKNSHSRSKTRDTTIEIILEHHRMSRDNPPLEWGRDQQEVISL